MGSASGEHDEATILKLIRLGRAIAQHGHVLVTGGCPGLPYVAACAAQEAGGLTFVISPGLSHYEHEHKYASPTGAYDVLIYTGWGLMEREVDNIRCRVFERLVLSSANREEAKQWVEVDGSVYWMLSHRMAAAQVIGEWFEQTL